MKVLLSSTYLGLIEHRKATKKRSEQLYYCLRDEMVFIPAENKVVAMEDMVKYLCDPYFRG